MQRIEGRRSSQSECEALFLERLLQAQRRFSCWRMTPVELLRSLAWATECFALKHRLVQRRRWDSLTKRATANSLQMKRERHPQIVPSSQATSALCLEPSST